jgi:parallel beta-helix repeat protein
MLNTRRSVLLGVAACCCTAPAALGQTVPPAIAWNRAQQVNTKEAYGEYLRLYPNSPQAAKAREALDRLSASAAPTSPPPQQRIARVLLGPGRDARTLAQAVELVAEGGLIEVENGTYEGSATITRGFTMRGLGDGGVFTASAKDTVTIVSGAVTIERLTFTNTGARNAIFVSGGEPTVRACKISNTGSKRNGATSGSEAAMLLGGGNALIDACIIGPGVTEGIHAHRTDGGTVQNCTITNSGWAISVHNSQTSFRSNTISGSVLVGYGARDTFEDNRHLDVGLMPYKLNPSSSATIRRNAFIFAGHTDPRVLMSGLNEATNVVFEDNRIES